MNDQLKLSRLSELESRLSTHILAYVTGDRPGMPSQISSDAIPRFRRHLEKIGEVESIGLFLYSRGGDTNVPWRLVNLIREYCKSMNVVVPFRAHSAATLISLGADKIYMGKMSELSPIDPTVANQFNPPDPANPVARIPISVEDVIAYRDLSSRFGIPEEGEKLAEQRAQVFLALAKEINPLALGNVHRSYNQIRKLATDLLNIHTAEGDRERVTKIVDTLTQQLFSHLHMIDRREATRLGLKVESVDSETDSMMWSLYESYAEEMGLAAPFAPQKDLGGAPSALIQLTRAVIETPAHQDAFISEGTISRMPGLAPGMNMPPGFAPQISVNFTSESWQETR